MKTSRAITRSGREFDVYIVTDNIMVALYDLKGAWGDCGGFHMCPF